MLATTLGMVPVVHEHEWRFYSAHPAKYSLVAKFRCHCGETKEEGV